jgi:hypothetical protein
MRINISLACAFVFVLGCTAAPAPATCDPACSPGFHCDNGSCVFDGNTVDGGGGDAPNTCSPACSGGTPVCNASHHCVVCVADGDCPNGQVCKVVNDQVSSCIPGCTDDSRCGNKKCCNKQCTDVTTDEGNCGACGTSCVASHAQSSCVASACTTGTCDFGYGDCDSNPKNGCEANLHLDTANCTACGMACNLANAVQACSDGCYIAACTFGWDDCNQNQDDGCETSVLSDAANCGACGSVCNGLPNAQANCTQGNCVLGKCNQGFYDCNNNPMDGCESNILVDSNNCNGCGIVCPQNLPFCNQGMCAVKPPCKNPLGGDQVHDNGAKLNELYCYLMTDTVQQRAQKACESHFGMGNCSIIQGGYNSMQYGQTGMGGGQGTIHWHYDNWPVNNCAPMYVIGDVVSPGWCGQDIGSFTK